MFYFLLVLIIYMVIFYSTFCSWLSWKIEGSDPNSKSLAAKINDCLVPFIRER
jgi:hypothetical protein